MASPTLTFQKRNMGYPLLRTTLWAWFLLALAVVAAAGQVPVDQTGSQPRANPPPPVASPPRFVVVLDAAHGGSDSGARINDQLLEKDVVLSLAVRLRSMLNARGIQVVTTRESDADPLALNRAEIANHAMAAVCISLHATATGSGVHLFTSSLGTTPMSRFLPWQSAQSAYVAQSLRLASEINSAMTHAEVPVSLGRTALQPLDSFACPAAAVEISPLGATETGGKPMELTNPDYQSRVVSAIVAAIQQWREDWKKP